MAGNWIKFDTSTSDKPEVWAFHELHKTGERNGSLFGKTLGMRLIQDRFIVLRIA